MNRKIILLSIAFLAVRAFVICGYENESYYPRMSCQQFAIAEAATKGHWFSWDKAKYDEILKPDQYVPIENFKNYKDSGKYETFPALDTPGLGYLIFSTSKLFGRELTSRYELALQCLAEYVGLFLFLFLVAKTTTGDIAILAGCLYLIGYPYVCQLMNRPMSDVFSVFIYSLVLFSLFLFLEMKKNVCFWMSVSLGVAALALWVRPSPYYFFFAVCLFLPFVNGKTRKEKITAVLLFALIPYLIFGLPFERFNLKYYGVSNTHFLGTQLWEGLGYVENNSYGCVRDDKAILSWLLKHGYPNMEYGSPEMNKALWDSSLKIIEQDPMIYLKSIQERIEAIFNNPLDLGGSFREDISLQKSGLSPFKFAKQHPLVFVLKCLMKVFSSKILAKAFWYLGLFSIVFIFSKHKEKRQELFLLISPFAYVSAIQIFLYFEPRYMIVGSWVLVFPISWFLYELYLPLSKYLRGKHE